jgi:hypothetical protein
MIPMIHSARQVTMPRTSTRSIGAGSGLITDQ